MGFLFLDKLLFMTTEINDKLMRCPHLGDEMDFPLTYKAEFPIELIALR
jgi:hypothetical protein